MVPAIMMTREQIAHLAQAAQRDETLWEALKDREVNRLNADGTPKIPSLSMLVRDFVNREYGSNHGYDVGSLIIEIRSHTRRELGMSDGSGDNDKRTKSLI